MKTKLFLFLFVAFLNSNLFASISKKSNSNSLTTTAITDSNFEQALINLGYDSGTVDGSVLTANISGVTTLTLQYLGITSLDGIEDFAALEEFSFYGNATALTDVDLSSNTNLKTITINGFTNLTNLNITGLASLIELRITTSNMMSSLDFTGVDNLEKLYLQNLTTLASINVTNLISLKEFSTSGLVAITSYDLSTLVALENLLITNNNLLTSVNLKTGVTANITYVQFQGNTSLTCVEVDAGVPIIGMSTWNQNNGAIFNEDCNNPSTYVPDDNFEAFLEANAMGNGVLNDDKVTTANINTVSNLNISNQSISDLTGIQDFTALTELGANSNNLTSVDVSNNVLLENIFLNSNSLITISVAKNLALKQLWVRENNLTDLDVSNNTALEWLVCSKNNIESLDLSLNVNASFLELHTNNLSVLNLKNIANTTISYFDAQLNPNLTCIQVDDAAYWTTNFSNQVDGSASFGTNCMYPTTSVPDIAFENYLETHDRDGNVVVLGDLASMGNGTANDGEVYTHRINTVTTLNVSNIGLSLLTGLEDFRDLENFGAFGGNPGLITADFSNNTKLKRITFSFNTNATSVTFGNLPDVVYIQLGYNNIANVDITGLPNLEEFKEFSGKFTTLDTSGNPNLKILSIQGAPLNSLDLSTNINLENISVTGTQLTGLNLSTNTKLKSVALANNQLTSLNLKNGFNTLIDTTVNPQAFNITNNPGLTCIQVDNVNYSNTNWTAIDSQHVFNTNCGQTYVPNAAFEAYLETHDRDGNVVPLNDPTSMGNGIANDDYVYTNRINTVIVLRVNGLSISDMTGIEDFAALQVLDAHNNNFSAIDVSSLSSLYQLAIGSNPINMLDVSANSNLRILEVNSTGLTNLDVTSNAVLEFLKIDDTTLTSIDTSQNPNLKTLSTENTPLTQVDLTNNTLLEFLELRDNALTGLDISNNLQLISFVLTGSPVTSLDLSQHDKLIEVRVNNNASLAQLNLKNGTNTNIPTSSFDITNNPSLTCVEVDDATYSNTNWTSKDAQHVYNTSCSSQQITLIPDPVFEQILINFNIDSDGVVNGQVFTSDIEYVGTLYLYCTSNCSSSTTPKITDLTGIEDFTSLIILEAGNNSIAGSLNLSNNTNLTHIRVQNNLITNLILGNNSNLKEIRAQGNNISAIDVSGNVNLEQINLDSNSLSTINLDQNTNLTKLYLNNNMLTTLDITNNNLLDNLHINNNQITSVDLTNKLNLSSFRAENNLLSGKIDFSNNTKLVDVHLNNNQLNTLDLSASVGLRLYEIRVANNSLVSLNLDNGYSQSSGPISFDTRNNLNLKCIQVPDVSLYQWVTDIDPHTSFNTDCSTVWSVMTNPATTAALLAVAGLDADNDGEITIAEAAAYTGTLDLSGSGIADVEGLAAFTGITTLDVSGNGITDLSPLTGSSFTTIAKSTGKTKIVQKTTTMALQTLIASNNNFDVLDVSSLSNLTTIDVSNNANLVTLNMQNGNNASITSFNAINTPNLSCILVDDVNASYLSTWVKDTKSEFVASEADCRAKVLSIDGFDVSGKISLYPNPVNTKLQIEVLSQLEIKNIKVFNLLGKILVETKNKEIDFSNFSKGIYLIKIATNKGVATKKVIKN